MHLSGFVIYHCKRFAQSAGPGHVVLCLRKRLPKSEKYRVKCSPFFGLFVFLLFGEYFDTLHHFGVTFITLAPLLESILLPWGHFYHFGTLLGSLLQPWVHFGSTLDALFASKIGLGRQRCPKRRHPGNKLTHLETFWRHIFVYFRIRMQTKMYSKYVPVFLRFLGRLGRFMGSAHMQSVHACAVQTHFSVVLIFL